MPNVPHRRKGLIITKLSHLLPKWFLFNASWLWLLWRVGILGNLMSIMLFYMGVCLRRFIYLFHQGFRARGRWFVSWTSLFMGLSRLLWETAPRAPFYKMLGQTHMNGWSRVIVSQNGGSTDYIFLFRLRVLQWSRHLFNYWNK